MNQNLGRQPEHYSPQPGLLYGQPCGLNDESPWDSSVGKGRKRVRCMYVAIRSLKVVLRSRYQDIVQRLRLFAELNSNRPFLLLRSFMTPVFYYAGLWAKFSAINLDNAEVETFLLQSHQRLLPHQHCITSAQSGFAHATVPICCI